MRGRVVVTAICGCLSLAMASPALASSGKGAGSAHLVLQSRGRYSSAYRHAIAAPVLRPSVEGAGGVGAASIAVVPNGAGSVEIVRGVDGTAASGPVRVSGLGGTQCTEPKTLPLDVEGTAVTPDGTLALVATDSNDLDSIELPASGSPKVGPRVDLSQFAQEGGNGYCTYTTGVAIAPDGKSALVATYSQGAVQMLREGNHFAVDTRVVSAGTDEGGHPHPPGWIRAPGSASEYGAAVISPVRGEGGDYVGLLDDGQHDAIAVVVGVGSRAAHVSAVLSEPALFNFGTGGQGSMAFVPGSATKAVVMTASGFAVLDLATPSAPTLEAATALPAGTAPQSLAVLPDGNHLAVTSDHTIYFYGGLSSAHGSPALVQSATPVIVGTAGDLIASVDATSGGSLAVDYFMAGSTTAPGDFVAVVTGGETVSPSYDPTRDVSIGGVPSNPNDMSVRPQIGGRVGYLTTTRTGQVEALGDETGAGSGAADDIVGIAATPGHGYWLVGADGGVLSFGDARFYGSLPALGITPAQPIVGIAPTPDYQGYWLVGADGGVFGFGDAHFHGSLPQEGLTPAAPVSGIASSGDGQGYLLAGEDGGVFAFGDAHFYGSLPQQGITPAARITGIEAAASGAGYWLAGADGGVFTFGQAPFDGSLPASGTVPSAPIVSFALTPDAEGYYLAASDGVVYPLGAVGFVPTLGTSLTGISEG